MNKDNLTEKLIEWLKKFLIAKYNADFNIDVFKPVSNFSKLPDERMKRIDGYPSFEFKTDILGVLEHKKTRAVELVVMNRSTSAISLKEIGEMNCYCRLVKPKHAFIGSLKGLPEEVNLILLNTNLEQKLLKIKEDLDIVIFKWDEQNDQIDEISIFPILQRADLNEF